ncbi:short-chain dehydrogenase [Fictibacillus sp. KU28468]|uniref:short-chain dehydrogenase n=1 Tax=Fictibacillus sp. KU28468 TaxID=2991053 RepID=UPI00223D2C9C|nr:short-chain dehydrogenase [Fictibacillus sp. KU28468]UZJ79433.1 short-chain dehydrogenase [Fictibacillus sp. KU28468]
MKNIMREFELSYAKGTDNRIKEVNEKITVHGLADSFEKANSLKVTNDTVTTKEVHLKLEGLADYILESENLTTKKNEYNILDAKRLKDIEINEQGLPSYKSDDEETSAKAEGELTNAIVNKERLIKHQDTVYKLLQGDYELINDGASVFDLWCYQTLRCEESRRLVKDVFGLIQYYLSQLKNTRNMRKQQVNRKKIKELLFGDIYSIVQSYTKLDPVQKRNGIKTNKKQSIELGEDCSFGNKHYDIFRALTTDKSSITKINTELDNIIDLEMVIDYAMNDNELPKKLQLTESNIEMIEILQEHYCGDLFECLKSDVNLSYNGSKKRFEKLIQKLVLVNDYVYENFLLSE